MNCHVIPVGNLIGWKSHKRNQVSKKSYVYIASCIWNGVGLGTQLVVWGVCTSSPSCTSCGQTTMRTQPMLCHAVSHQSHSRMYGDYIRPHYYQMQIELTFATLNREAISVWYSFCKEVGALPIHWLIWSICNMLNLGWISKLTSNWQLSFLTSCMGAKYSLLVGQIVAKIAQRSLSYFGYPWIVHPIASNEGMEETEPVLTMALGLTVVR